NGRVYHNPFDPTFERTITFIVADVLKNLDETILQNILRFLLIFRIPQAHAKQFAVQFPKNFLLGNAAVLFATFNKLHLLMWMPYAHFFYSDGLMLCGCRALGFIGARLVENLIGFG